MKNPIMLRENWSFLPIHAAIKARQKWSRRNQHSLSMHRMPDLMHFIQRPRRPRIDTRVFRTLTSQMRKLRLRKVR